MTPASPLAPSQPTGRSVMIGLEIHGYLNLPSKRKLFCDCAIDPDAEENTTICPICTGAPGSKPMLPNREAIEKVVEIGMLLGCAINHAMLFQRKHYNWPDLPLGYQKTVSGSYGIPSAEHGSLFGIRIREIHLEEDPARWDPETGEVDYNRSGYPLLELVTEPDFSSAEDVAAWLKSFLTAMGYVNALEPKLGIKCDVNVSIAPDFIRSEIKNINSIRSIKDAIAYEIFRQQREPAMQQTRAFDAQSGKTIFMRSKEQAADYLFIPEPDLPIVEVDAGMVKRISQSLPESPERKYQRLVGQGIATIDARVICANLELAELFEHELAILHERVGATYLAKWFVRDIAAIADDPGLLRLHEYKDQLAALLDATHARRITDVVAKDLLRRLSAEFIDIEKHIKTNGLEAMGAQDNDELESIITSAIATSADAVADAISGKEKAVNAIVGKVMQQTRGKARPDDVKKMILQRIRQSDGAPRP